MRTYAFLVTLLLCLPSFAQSIDATRAKLVQIADAVVKAELGSRYSQWRWSNGVLDIALLKLAHEFENKNYEAFVKKNYDFIFDNYDNDANARMRKLELPSDMGPMGSALIEINASAKEERFEQFIKTIAKRMQDLKRLKDGTIVSAKPLEWTLESDNVYMVVCFLSRLWERTKNKEYLDDAIAQVQNGARYLFRPDTGLMRHAYFTEDAQSSLAYWGRANGWFLMAELDLLDRLPQRHPKRQALLNLLRTHISGIARYQGPDGLWHQLVDKSDSFAETSSSAMFVYGIARAVNKGYIAPRFAAVADEGWKGLQSKIRADGQIESVSLGVEPSLPLTAFYRRETPLNEVIGIAAVLLAGSEILQLK